MLRSILRRATGVLLCLSAFVACSCAQSNAPAPTHELSWSTDSTRRFVSAHGRRAAIFGYSQDGLEVWAYPFQILSSLSVSFREPATTSSIEGASLLRRVVYSPEAMTRIYAGPDFIVRERLFVPLEEPGVVISYEVDAARPVEISIRFTPVLDLMWPASVGGQETAWNSDASAYVLSEASHRFVGIVESPDISAHDETPNSARNPGSAPGLAFTLRADRKKVRFIVAGGRTREAATATVTKLLEQSDVLEKDSVSHYANLLNGALQVETPDYDINRALAWAEVTLDQAWVCNSDLGCAVVAGYGPSRKARRPQYDWFFAGDGMVAIEALLNDGQYERAREELEFILKYQDPKTGMIWHELSQSAGWLDWTKYPYMWLHVDLTFDFLNTVGKYLSVTGDQEFVRAHWASIQSARGYCQSLLDPKDGLPRIPSEKRGQREQEEFSDELTLSASWLNAARAFGDLAQATGHTAEAEEARAAGERAQHAIDQRYWDESQNFWITGYSRPGKAFVDRNLGPVGALETPIFSAAQRNSVLDQLASSDFQTDWGTRGRAASSSTYAPNSYASGSVWAIGTAGMASAFWGEHRPATAWPIWSALIPWSSLDSLGHMHEALAGDYYHEETESVPEQTWSSSTFLTATVSGMLGIEVNATSHHLTLAPHLPPNWHALTLRNLRVGASQIVVHILQSDGEIRLELENSGPAVNLRFNPEIPFGAELKNASLDNRPVKAAVEPHQQDTHVNVEFTVPHGSTSLVIGYTGGMAIIPEFPQLLVGDSSQGLKITGLHRSGMAFTVNFDAVPSIASAFEFRTSWRVQNTQGATVESVSPNLYRVIIPARAAALSDGYQHGAVTLNFTGIK